MDRESEQKGGGGPTVVHTINNLDVGGVETMALETIRHFERWGENRLVVIDGRRQPRRPEFDDLGVPVSVWDHRPGQYGQLVLKAYRYFQSIEADALLCWSYGNHAFVGLGARLAGLSRNVVSVQNAPPSRMLDLWKWRLLGGLGLPTMKKMAACSAYVKEQMVSEVWMPKTTLETAYNSCDVTAVNEAATASGAPRSGGPVIGMVARLNEIKDHPTLIRALPDVLEAHPKAELWIVGDGERRNGLEGLVKELNLGQHVQFLGNRSDVPALLGQMDVFALITTGAEGLPLVLTEALAAQLPIVATDVGPCAEVLKEGEWGRLVDAGRPEAVAEGIVEALAGTVHSPTLQEVNERYDTRASAERYWSLLFEEERKPIT